MEDETPRAGSIKVGIRACHRELIEISELLGSGIPSDKKQAKRRMNNIRRLANSISTVLDRWDEELQEEQVDKDEFIKSVTETINKLDSLPLDT